MTTTTAMKAIEREALSISEAAAAAGVSRTTLYQLLAVGDRPPTIRMGRRRLIRVEALREWLLKEWGREVWENDPWSRAQYGLPPDAYGDYAVPGGSVPIDPPVCLDRGQRLGVHFRTTSMHAP